MPNLVTNSKNHNTSSSPSVSPLVRYKREFTFIINKWVRLDRASTSRMCLITDAFFLFCFILFTVMLSYIRFYVVFLKFALLGVEGWVPFTSGLWIRIHFLQIRIQQFFLNEGPDPGGKINADPSGSVSSLTNFVK